MWCNQIHPDDQEWVIQAVEHAKQHRSLYNPEHRVIRADTGTIAWLSLFGRFIYNDTGEAIRFTGVSFNINDRKQTELDLQQSLKNWQILSLRLINHPLLPLPMLKELSLTSMINSVKSQNIPTPS